MKAKGTWVFLFFAFLTFLVGLALNFALRDIFVWLQVDNYQVLGDSFRLNSLIASSIAVLLGVFFGFFFSKTRAYIEQCVVEFNKVAWPSWQETKRATFTVLVVSFVGSVILGVFDTFFSWASKTSLFY